MFDFLKKKAPPEKVAHIATVPTARVLKKFIALKTFESQDLKSTYCQGYEYSIREGDEVLATLAPLWYSEGRIKWLT